MLFKDPEALHGALEEEAMLRLGLTTMKNREDQKLVNELVGILQDRLEADGGAPLLGEYVEIEFDTETKQFKVLRLY